MNARKLSNQQTVPVAAALPVSQQPFQMLEILGGVPPKIGVRAWVKSIRNDLRSDLRRLNCKVWILVKGIKMLSIKKPAQTALQKPFALTSPGVTFLVRHGECLSNTRWPIENYNDRIDTLTELGAEQAMRSSLFFKDLLPSITWCIQSSTLTRAVQTAEIIASQIKSKILPPDKRIIEFSSQRENYDDLHARLHSYLSEAKNIKNHERLIVVTHGHVLENILCKALDAPINPILKGDHGGQKGLVTHNNGGVSALYEDQILIWNSNRHLFG
jgi:broad specificity phosphatase PhoE